MDPYDVIVSNSAEIKKFGLNSLPNSIHITLIFINYKLRFDFLNLFIIFDDQVSFI